MWEHELVDNTFLIQHGKSALAVNGDWQFDLETMHGHPLPEGLYRLDILLQSDPGSDELNLYQVNEDGEKNIETEKSDHGVFVEIDILAGRSVRLTTNNLVLLKGLILKKL